MNTVKYLITLFLFVVSSYSFGATKATYNFMEIFEEQLYYKNHLETYNTNINGKIYQSYKMLFNTSIDQRFFDLHKDVVADVINQKYLAVTNYNDYQQNGFQCVGLVKVASGMTLQGTSTWIRDKLFGYDKNNGFPDKGTILATFGKDGKYNQQHTVVYYGVINGVHYVIDANWDIGKGYIQIHPINYKKQSTSVDVIGNLGNIGTYYSVK